MTSNQAKDMNRNPEGKGGFKDNPQNRSDGRWSKENSFTYWMNFFKHLTVKEFKEYQTKKPESERTMAEQLAFTRVNRAKDLKEFECVANRTEGMPIKTVIQDTTVNLGNSISQEVESKVDEFLRNDKAES